MTKRIILSSTKLFIRIQNASSTLKLDLKDIIREYGINEKTAQMLEDKVDHKSH